jgi:hypothetical protein
MPGYFDLNNRVAFVTELGEIEHCRGGPGRKKLAGASKLAARNPRQE